MPFRPDIFGFRSYKITNLSCLVLSLLYKLTLGILSIQWDMIALHPTKENQLKLPIRAQLSPSSASADSKYHCPWHKLKNQAENGEHHMYAYIL